MKDDEEPVSQTTDINVAIPSDAEIGGGERDRKPSLAEDYFKRIGGEIPLLFITSIIVLTEASILCDKFRDADLDCEKEYAFAVAVGAISVTICLIDILCNRFANGMLPEIWMPGISVFLFVWWTAGLAVLTFDEPFKGLGSSANAYLGTWASFILSIRLATANTGRGRLYFQKTMDSLTSGANSTTIGCLALSAIALGDSIKPFQDDKDSSYNILAIVVCTLSIFICLVLMGGANTLSSTMKKWLALFLVLLWIAGAGVCTFKGPFVQATNGYFGMWGSLFCAFFLFDTHRSNEEAST